MPRASKTINFLGLELDIEFRWEKEEKEVRTYSNGDPGHPGCPAEFEIERVIHEDTDITKYFSMEAFFAMQDEIERTKDNY